MRNYYPLPLAIRSSHSSPNDLDKVLSERASKTIMLFSFPRINFLHTLPQSLAGHDETKQQETELALELSYKLTPVPEYPFYGQQNHKVY